jgi:hypothetical protein
MEFDINLESERGEVLATVGDPQNRFTDFLNGQLTSNLCWISRAIADVK